MNTGVAIWLVFCVGASLLSAAQPKKTGGSNQVMRAFGFGAVIWSAGLAVWWLAGVVAASLSALN